MRNRSHEQAYLEDLLKDFALEPDIDAQRAVVLIQARYAILLENIDIITNSLFPPAITGVTPSIVPPLSILPKMIHGFLYNGILLNAGEYRHSDEPNSGVVLFGAGQRFKGTSPSQISEEIAYTFDILTKKDSDPIWCAAVFYQRFVQIHPFYDANGRIGRAIVTAYLDQHGLFMNWEAMEKNSKWLKRLNDCHKRYGKPTYDEYIGYHVAHWRQFIIQKSKIFSEDA